MTTVYKVRGLEISSSVLHECLMTAGIPVRADSVQVQTLSTRLGSYASEDKHIKHT